MIPITCSVTPTDEIEFSEQALLQIYKEAKQRYVLYRAPGNILCGVIPGVEDVYADSAKHLCIAVVADSVHVQRKRAVTHSVCISLESLEQLLLHHGVNAQPKTQVELPTTGTWDVL